MRKRTPSIHLLVVVIVLVPIIAVSLALIALANYTNRSVESELSAALVRTTAQRIGDNLSSVFQTAERTSELYAHRVQSGSVPPLPSDDWERLMYESMLIRPALGSITYASADGQATYVMRIEDDFIAGRCEGPGENQTREYKLDANGQPSPTILRTYKYDVRQRPWYQAASAHETPIWSDIYFWFSSTPAGYTRRKIPGIGYVRHVVDAQGKCIGVLSVDVKLESLSNILSDMQIARFGKTMIIDANHRVLASSTQEQGEEPEYLINLAELQDSNSQAARQALQQDSSTSRSVHLKDHAKHVYIEPLRAAPALQWVLITILPDANVSGQIRPMQRNALLVGGIIVLAALVLGLILARLLSRPVAKLARHMHDIGAGKFDQTIHLTNTREFQQLSLAVNEMTSRLAQQVRLQVEKEAIERASATKNAFFNRVTHELRTPLNAIIGYTEMLEEYPALQQDDTALQDLQRIMRASHQLLTLINELLELARSESSTRQLRLSDVDPQKICQEVEELIRPLAQRNHNQFALTILQSPPMIRSDPQKLKQVLTNLVANAAKFTHHGKIDLSLESDRNHVVFTVRDTGIGVDPQKIEQMFEPFAQADMTTEGTGLGLPICRQFVQMLGGEIQMTSRPGQGTVVYVDLPVNPERSQSTTDPVQHQIRGTP